MKTDRYLELLEGWEDKNTLTQLRDGFGGALFPFFALATASLTWFTLAALHELWVIEMKPDAEVFLWLLVAQVIPGAAARWLSNKFPAF